MRIKLRLLGTDLIELLTGHDAQAADDPSEERGPGCTSADLTLAAPFGIQPPDDWPRTTPDESTPRPR